MNTDVIEKIIKGTINLMYYGVSKLDRTNTKKYIISIESPQLAELKEDKEIIENYAKTPFKPKWFTEDSKKINLKTLYDIPVEYNNSKIDLSSFLSDYGNFTTNAEVKIKLRFKNGACYPVALQVISLGEEKEEYNPFTDFDEV